MNTLLGVIPASEQQAERLLILDKGRPDLLPAGETDPATAYPNYDLLKSRPTRINSDPITGAGVFNFRYGPVTSGIREAGCFHLYTYGEKILRAGIDIEWKERQIENAMAGATPEYALQMAERVCSNFAFSHSAAYCRAVEMALGIDPDLCTRNWRALLLEAERVSNHLYQVYKLSAAAAQKVLAAHLSSLFEDSLRLNHLLTGSRYLMGINNIGPLKRLPTEPDTLTAATGYLRLSDRFRRLYEHSLTNFNYLDRLHAAGTLTAAQAGDLGLSGPTLRACGIDDHLNGGAEHLISLPVITQNEGDAMARMEIRSEEIVNSCQYLAQQLKACDDWPNNHGSEGSSHPGQGIGWGVANSPSGALGYFLEVRDNRVVRAGIFTPSYPGMHAVSRALEGQIFTDFPFIFDSFGVHFADAAR